MKGGPLGNTHILVKDGKQEMMNKEDFVTTVKGNMVNADLTNIKVVLQILQAAALMAQEGCARATAGEIAARAMKEFNIQVTAATVGLTLAPIALGKAVSHGKSRFLLDLNHLEEARRTTEGRAEEMIRNLEKSRAAFKELSGRIESLQEEWKKILQLHARRRELTKLISENQDQPVKMAQVEARWRQLQGEAQKAVELEKECQALSTKVKSLPSLKVKEASYQARLVEFHDQEKGMASREANFAQIVNQWKERERQLIERETRFQLIIKKLTSRESLVNLASLDLDIEVAKAELERLSKQLGEKRSLLDKLLGRNKEGG